ncbi:MAG: Dabb family protein [Variibacter sp.]
MIRHIVFFSAKTKADIVRVREGLKALGTIPFATRFEVTENIKVDRLCDTIDVVVYGEFPDAAALAAFKAHPTYAATTAAVRPLRELRFSADIVSD